MYVHPPHERPAAATSFRRVLLLNTAVACGVVLFLGALFAWQAYLIEQQQRRLLHSSEVRRQVDLVVGTLARTESGQRGYLITNDDAFLAPYRTSLPQVAPQLKQLADLVQDEPAQEAAVQDVIAQASQWRSNADKEIRLKRDRDPAFPTYFHTGRGADLMQAMLDHLGAIRAAEISRFDQGRSTLRHITLVYSLLALAGLIAAAAFFALFGLNQLRGLARSYMQSLGTIGSQNEALQNSQEELQAANEELTAQSEELASQAEELRAQQEELQSLYEALQQHTERVEAEVAERTREVRAQATLIELAQDAIFVRNWADDRIQFWNQGAERVYGWSRAAAIGRVAEDLLETDWPQPLDEIREILLREGHWEGELRHARSDGQWLTVDSRWALQRSDAGAPEAILVISTDITERKLAEARRRLFELLVQSISDYAIYALDPQGRIVSWNKGAERFKGYTTEEAIGMAYAQFFTPEDRQAGKPQALLDRAAREGHVEDQGWRVRKDGSRFWADAVLTALRDDQGRLIGFAKVTRDLTERRLLAEERLASERERVAVLEQADRLKDQFLAILSHELRTPINAITGFASILEDEVVGPLTAEQRTYLQKVLSGADILLALVNDLLDMSRIRAGRFSLEPQAIDVAPIAKRVLASLSTLADEKGLQLIDEVPDALPALLADDRRVAQIITNLVGNAIKFTPVGGKIWLRARMDDEGLYCEVQDTGLGIAVEDFARLFQPFSQLDASSTRQAGGTGLGLSITKALVEAHGGTIGVQSEGHGKGSTFWFRLPRAGTHEA